MAVFITFTQIAKSEDLRVRRIDWVGFVTFSVSLFLLVFALVRGNDFGWGSATTVGLLVGAAVLMVAFFVNERYTGDPMLDLGLFKIPAFVGLSTTAFTLAASIFAMFLYLTLYIQDNLGYGPLAAGVRFLPMTLLIFFTSFFAGRLTVRVPSRLLLGVGMLVVTGGLLLMATTHPNSTWTVLLPGFLVCGFGVGIVNPVLASGAVSVVQPQRSGMASGANNTFRQVGIATGHRRAGRGLPEPDRGAHHCRARASRPTAPRSCAGAVRSSRPPCRRGGAQAAASSSRPAARNALLHAYHSGFSITLNHLMEIGASGCLRWRDQRLRLGPPARLHHPDRGQAAPASGPGAPAADGRARGERRTTPACPAAHA